MKKIMKIFWVAVFALNVLSTSSLIAAENDNCKAVFDMYCTRCHKIDRICAALEIKDEEAWVKTVAIMAGYGKYDEQEQKWALDCLVTMRPGSPLVCK